MLLLLGVFLILFPLLLGPAIWGQSIWANAAALLIILIMVLAGISGVLFGVALASNTASWTVDANGVHCERRKFLKRENWSEPLRGYDRIRLVNLARIGASSPAFQIELRHSSDATKNVPLAVLASYETFRRRGEELVALLHLPLDHVP